MARFRKARSSARRPRSWAEAAMTMGPHSSDRASSPDVRVGVDVRPDPGPLAVAVAYRRDSTQAVPLAPKAHAACGVRACPGTDRRSSRRLALEAGRQSERANTFPLGGRTQGDQAKSRRQPTGSSGPAGQRQGSASRPLRGFALDPDRLGTGNPSAAAGDVSSNGSWKRRKQGTTFCT
jgi:hypothetical protein